MRFLLLRVVVVIISGVAVGLAADNDSVSVVLHTKEQCRAVLINDSTVQITCPDSTCLRATILKKSKKKIVAHNPYIGIIHLKKRQFKDSDIWDFTKKDFRTDPMRDRTFLTTTAFIRGEYPIGVSILDLFFNSVDATVTPTTQLYINFAYPHFFSIHKYTAAIKQQVYVSKRRNMAAAVSLALTHPRSWEKNAGNPLYMWHAKALFSYEFFPRGELHASFLYTVQKKYRKTVRHIDGTSYYNYDEYFQNDFGFSLGFTMQPFRCVKFIGEISDAYGYFADEPHSYSFYAAFGPRFLIKRCVLDLGCGFHFQLQQPYRRYLKPSPPLPLVRCSWFIGRKKNR